MIVEEKMLVDYCDRVAGSNYTTDMTIVVKKQRDDKGNIKTKVCGWHYGEPDKDSIKAFSDNRLFTDFGDEGVVTRIERIVSYFKNVDVTIIWEHGYYDTWENGEYKKSDMGTQAIVGAHAGRPNEKTWECVGQVEFVEEKK